MTMTRQRIISPPWPLRVECKKVGHSTLLIFQPVKRQTKKRDGAPTRNVCGSTHRGQRGEDSSQSLCLHRHLNATIIFLLFQGIFWETCYSTHPLQSCIVYCKFGLNCLPECGTQMPISARFFPLEKWMVCVCVCVCSCWVSDGSLVQVLSSN